MQIRFNDGSIQVWKRDSTFCPFCKSSHVVVNESENYQTGNAVWGYLCLDCQESYFLLGDAIWEEGYIDKIVESFGANNLR